MKQVNLDNEDIKILKEDMIQVILMHLLILIVFSIASFWLISILKQIILNFNSLFAYTILTLGYLSFLIYSLWPRIKELNIGLKGIEVGLITNKKETIKYGWSGEIGADLMTQPQLIEFFFTINDQDIWIEKKYYNQFNVGDNINIHFSLRKGKIIKITS